MYQNTEYTTSHITCTKTDRTTLQSPNYLSNKYIFHKLIKTECYSKIVYSLIIKRIKDGLEACQCGNKHCLKQTLCGDEFPNTVINSNI